MSRPMKDSGLEWIGEIPEDWSVTQLGRIGKFSASGIDKKVNEKEVPVKIINYTDIYKNKSMMIDSTIDFMEVTCPLDKRESHLVEVGDIIFTPSSETIEEIGRSSVVYEIVENLSFSYHVLKYHPLIEMNLSFKKYLCNNHFLYNYFSSKAVGTIRKTLNRQDFKLAPVLIPTIKEQQKIADFLDEKMSQIDSIIENTTQSIVEFKKYKQALITETVTKGLNPDVKMKNSGIEWIGDIPEHWDMTKMKRLGSVRNGLTYSPEDIVDEGAGTLVLRSGNIQNAKLSFKDTVYVSRNISDSLYVKNGDILICSRNGSRSLIGKNAVIDTDMKATFGAFMMLFRTEELSKYIFYILNSEVFNFYLGTFLTATINQLTKNNFDNMNVVFCANPEEQQQIISFLDEKCAHIDSLIADKEKLIGEFETYKKALIFEYVTGKKAVE